MEIKVKRAKELKKGGLLSENDVKLSLEISVSLSEEERALVQKYRDLSIYAPAHEELRPEGVFEVVRVDSVEDGLSKFKLIAHTDKGIGYLPYLSKLQENIVARLTNDLRYLKILDRWEGEEVLNIE